MSHRHAPVRAGRPGRVGRARRVHPVARVVAVGAVAAAALAGAATAGTPETGRATTASAGVADDRDVAVEETTLTCPGDPYAGQQGAGERQDPPDVQGEARVEDPGTEVLEGLVNPPDGGRPATIDAGPSGGDAEAPGAVEGLADDPVTARGTGTTAPGLVASQVLTADGGSGDGDGDAAGGGGGHGLAVTPCAPPAADLWLVAGGGQPGRQERLVLTNPGGNPLTADVTFLTADGPADPGAGQDVVVPPGGRTVLSLDALSGTGTPQVVHVQSTGGRVTAAISDTWREGLTASGLELVGPTAAPSTRLVLPGNANGSERGLLLGAPGDQDAVVDVRAVGEQQSRSVAVETVPAGGIAEVELPVVPGVHSWVVESDEPVVAGGWARTDPGRGGVRDVAWSVAAPSVGRLGGAALPALGEGTRSFVEVVAPDDAPVEAEIFVSASGESTTRQVRVPAGRSQAVDVGAASAVWVRTEDDGVRSAVLISRPSDAQLTSLPVLPVPLTVRDVPVVPAAD